ncbi:uncharacterized protein BDZ99DRAFT_522961 [Mytilinidion resinicola]|uniref:Uncharacterized protein n=1 Tax=Mytilinidion resinicola TaxID=574789 RepID=A0A6A6YH55_9PEZI|nr:uncharacterized protein BDZ99DRAFT_522961 [Mytilinidion resinicola]KAF2807345.1 hypothetical protein BDZ99DRAFT_522961 [Mytilinidion resinicola]
MRSVFIHLFGSSPPPPAQQLPQPLPSLIGKTAYEKFKWVQEACKIISNTTTRAELDRKMRKVDKLDSSSLGVPIAKARARCDTGFAVKEGSILTRSANIVYAKAQRELQLGAQSSNDANDCIPADYPRHPDVHQSSTPAARATEISEACPKASILSTEAFANFLLAHNSFEQAIELLGEAKEHTMSTIKTALEQQNQAKSFASTANADARKCRVLAMAWYTEAKGFARGETDDQDD